MHNSPNNEDLPVSLAQMLSGYRRTQIFEGWSESKVFRLDGSNNKTLYLKTSPRTPERSLWAENRRLEWLRPKLPVPELLIFVEDEVNEYLLMTEIPGKPASQCPDQADVSQIIERIAAALHTIHNLAIALCPFDESVDLKIERARQRMKLGLVNETDFDERYHGMSAKELFKEVIDRRPTREDLVFTHGDFCLPNIILKDTSVSGFVDLGRAGVSDRYQDIALITRSIRYNYGLNRDERFLDAYGIKPDDDKLEFYMLLDELF
jgi:kanamycin kinase/aminoglycoside 3'-phosphotransferase-2